MGQTEKPLIGRALEGLERRFGGEQHDAGTIKSRRHAKIPLTVREQINTFCAVIRDLNIRLLGNALLLGSAAVGF